MIVTKIDNFETKIESLYNDLSDYRVKINDSLDKQKSSFTELLKQDTTEIASEIRSIRDQISKLGLSVRLDDFFMNLPIVASLVIVIISYDTFMEWHLVDPLWSIFL